MENGEGGEPGSAAEKPQAPSGYAALNLSWCQLAQLWVSSAAWGWAWRRRLVTRLRGWGLAERVWWKGWVRGFRSGQAWREAGPKVRPGGVTDTV